MTRKTKLWQDKHTKVVKTEVQWPIRCADKGKSEWSQSRNSTVMDYAIMYNAVEKVDEVLAGKYMQQGIQ